MKLKVIISDDEETFEIVDEIQMALNDCVIKEINSEIGIMYIDELSSVISQQIGINLKFSLRKFLTKLSGDTDAENILCTSDKWTKC